MENCPQVDNMGVMVMATAHYLRRNIHLYVACCVRRGWIQIYGETKPHNSRIGYDPPGHPTERGYSLTVIEGEGGENYAPLTIFYHDRCYSNKTKQKEYLDSSRIS